MERGKGKEEGRVEGREKEEKEGKRDTGEEEKEGLEGGREELQLRAVILTCNLST